MKLIQINKNFSIGEFEDKVSKLNSNQHYKIQVPQRLSGITAFGLEASLFQYISTVSRKTNNSITAKTHFQSGHQDKFQEYFESAARSQYGIIWLTFASTCTDAQDKPLDLAEAKKITDSYLDSLYDVEKIDRKFVRGNAINFHAFFQGKYQYPSFFFEKSKSVDRLKYKNNFIKSMDDLQEIAGDKQQKTISTEIKKSIGSIVFELVDNANKYSKYKSDRSTFYPSAFTLSLRQVSGNYDDFLKRFSDPNSRPIYDYISLVGRNNTYKKLYFIEINVVDTGAGIASYFASSETSELKEQDELRILKNCFNVGVTSEKQPGSGYGLSNTLSDLVKHNGFIRIRSGRQHLFASPTEADYNAFIHTDNNDANEKDMADLLEVWPSEKQLSETAGTLVSITIPVFNIAGDG